MEPSALAAMAVGLLAPYLAKAGEVIAEEAGMAAWKGAQALFNTIKKKVKGDEYAEKTLKRLEEQPESPGRAAAFSEVLSEKIAEDPAFASLLEQSVQEAKGSGDNIHQEVRLSDHARAGDINMVGKGGAITSKSKS